MDATDALVVRCEQHDAAIEDRDLDCVVREHQSQVVILDGIARILVTVNSAEVEDILLITSSLIPCLISAGIFPPRQTFTDSTSGFMPFSSMCPCCIRPVPGLES